jgi:hypothetical protein
MNTTKDTKEAECDINERRLCSDCVGEEFLSAKIEKHGEQATCFYCGQAGKTFSIDDMADEIETAFDEHFHQTPTEPSSLEYAMTRYSPHGWLRDGEPIVEVVGSAAEIDEAPAIDICEVLAGRHADMELAKMGDESPFDSDSHYVENDVNDLEYFEQWKFFENSLKSEARFFSRTAEATLTSVFDDLAGHKTADGNPVIVEAGPGKEITCFFRARVFQSDERLESALKRPDLEIGSPPSIAAPAGRMNARGISVFYGATDASIAVAEVRPPVGSRVVVGRFDLVRAVRLLDVEALRSVTVTGSIFDPDHIRRLKRAKFLERLSHRLTMPVMPDDEPLDYLVTQAISDYLATVAETPLDGIIYPSAQGVDGKLNVVLFHKAARVELLDLPKGTEIDAQLHHWTDEGPEIDYWVWESVPAEVATNAKKDDGSISFPLFEPELRMLDYDARAVTLRLDTGTLEVHHVQGVVFNTDSHSVRRHRSPKVNDKF